MLLSFLISPFCTIVENAGRGLEASPLNSDLLHRSESETEPPSFH